MEVRAFSGEYSALAELSGRPSDELRHRDEQRPGPVQRWIAFLDGTPTGAVMAQARPDDRTFLTFVEGRPDAMGPLSHAVVEALGRSVYAGVDAAEGEAEAALRSAGFVTELTAERFCIAFAPILGRLDRAWVPSGMRIQSADTVDEARLFELDNRLRQDVPGTDGWRGDRKWVHEELAETPPFDPTAYLVGVVRETGEYAGLVRIWRNPSGPRLGLVGVLRPFRTTSLAAALLKHALGAAATWGHVTFTTETSLTNRAIHPRLKKLAAESLGRFHQLVLHPATSGGQRAAGSG